MLRKIDCIYKLINDHFHGFNQLVRSFPAVFLAPLGILLKTLSPTIVLALAAFSANFSASIASLFVMSTAFLTLSLASSAFFLCPFTPFPVCF